MHQQTKRIPQTKGCPLHIYTMIQHKAIDYNLWIVIFDIPRTDSWVLGSEADDSTAVSSRRRTLVDGIAGDPLFTREDLPTMPILNSSPGVPLVFFPALLFPPQ
jgi:hypothetical protein